MDHLQSHPSFSTTNHMFKTTRAIKIIKPDQTRMPAIIPAPMIRELSESELKEERVVTINNWISQRRENDSQEKAFVRSGIKAWRESNLSALVNKI